MGRSAGPLGLENEEQAHQALQLSLSRVKAELQNEITERGSGAVGWFGVVFLVFCFFLRGSRMSDFIPGILVFYGFSGFPMLLWEFPVVF